MSEPPTPPPGFGLGDEPEDIGEYPEARPTETGFGPLDSDNMREWHRNRRRWEAEQRNRKP